MKKVLFTLVGFAIMFSSCQKSDNVFVVDEENTLLAQIEKETSAKTVLGQENNVLWSEGDQIVAFLKSSLGAKYQITSEGVGKNSGRFTKISSGDDALNAGMELNHNVCYYPYIQNMVCSRTGDNYALAVVLPSVQTYVTESFASGTFPMVAVSKDNQLTFNNILGGIKLQFKGNLKLTSIKIEGKHGEKLSGEAFVIAYADYSKPAISMGTSAAASVTLDCGNGVQLDENQSTEFIISLPPIIFTKGLTVTVTDSNGDEHIVETDKENTVLRSYLLVMPEVTLKTSDINDVQSGDYFDEYGINHGPGIKIGETTWAPVNCGYHATDYKYGKLYQWGRKFGQGYNGNLYDSDGIRMGNHSDVKEPIIRVGSVLSTDGNILYNADIFYTGIGLIQNNWCYSMDNQLWNSGTEEFPIKTENDPCPSGWRVPTFTEAHQLRENESAMMTDESNISGKWLSGKNKYNESIPKVFFPAAGYRYHDGEARYRGCLAGYWTSKCGERPSYIGFSYNGKMSMGYLFCASALPVRCVKDETGFIEVSSVEINASSINLNAGESYSLSATLAPSNSTLKSVSWYSSDISVVVVDTDGKLSAVSKGDAVISAISGSCRAICNISVSDSGDNDIYYIDENGVNRGKAVKIGETVWAPVNCGYHETDYKYGKMYQWGRKYGQGFDGDRSTPDDGSYLQISELAEAFDQKYAYYFFRGGLYFSVAEEQADMINWNFGTEDKPVKTQYDPCPIGWRVPTINEFKQLIVNHSPIVTDEETGMVGMWFSGSNTYKDNVPRIFLPSAGNLYWAVKNIPDYRERGISGYYFASSSRFTSSADFLVESMHFYNDKCFTTSNSPSGYGKSVRCVRE